MPNVVPTIKWATWLRDLHTLRLWPFTSHTSTVASNLWISYKVPFAITPYIALLNVLKAIRVRIKPAKNVYANTYPLRVPSSVSQLLSKRGSPKPSGPTYAPLMLELFTTFLLSFMLIDKQILEIPASRWARSRPWRRASSVQVLLFPYEVRQIRGTVG